MILSIIILDKIFREEAIVITDINKGTILREIGRRKSIVTLVTNLTIFQQIVNQDLPVLSVNV